MHSAVMQNKKYIKFADDNTVEVLSLSRLDEAVQKEDPKAAKYKDKDGVEYMVEWPNLTYDEMIALSRSKANSYNDTGGIPFTAILNPHTLKEMGRGYRAAGAIMDAVKEFAKELEKEHGKGISRKVIRAVDESIADADAHLAKGDFHKAAKEIDKVESKAKDWPEPLTKKLAAARERMMEAGRTAIAEAMALEPAKAKRELSRLITKLRGTGLEDEAREKLTSIGDQ